MELRYMFVCEWHYDTHKPVNEMERVVPAENHTSSHRQSISAHGIVARGTMADALIAM